MPRSGSALRPIVLIDDNADDLVLTRRLIERADIATCVLTFASSEAALAHLQSVAGIGHAGTASDGLPSVIFLDRHMPGLDGFDVLQQLRQHRAFANVKIIMLSHSAATQDRERAMRLGANHYLLKFPAATLVAALVAAEAGSS